MGKYKGIFRWLGFLIISILFFLGIALACMAIEIMPGFDSEKFEGEFVVNGEWQDMATTMWLFRCAGIFGMGATAILAVYCLVQTMKYTLSFGYDIEDPRPVAREAKKETTAKGTAKGTGSGRKL